MPTLPDDSLPLELAELVETQRREEVRLRHEQFLRQAFFVAPIFVLVLGVWLFPRLWFLSLGLPVVVAVLLAQFKGSEDRFHALFWGNVVALLGFFALTALGSVIPVL